MKSIFLTTLFLLIPKLCISQVIITATANDYAVYLDSLFNIGTEQNYKYVRVIKDFYTLNQESYEVKDYYKSGKIAMSGTTSTRDKITGTLTYYYENGNKKAITNYKLDKKYGEYFEFYENGNKKLQGECIDDDKTIIPNLKIINYWDSNTNQTIKEGNGYYEEVYTKPLEVFSKGKIINNLKDSIWIGECKKTKSTFKENYKDGKLISGESIDENNLKSTYIVLEKNPEPKNGLDDFYNHIARNFKMPDIVGLRGKVYLTFVIEADGSIKDVKVLRDIGYGTGKEAVKAISSYKNWIPGEQRGIKVRCNYSMPIDIKTSR